MLFGHIVEGAPHSINIFKVPMGGTASNCSLSLGQRDSKLEDGFELLPRTDQVQAFRSQRYCTWVFLGKGKVRSAILVKRNVKAAKFSPEEVMQLIATAADIPIHLVEEDKEHKSKIEAARVWVTLDLTLRATLTKCDSSLLLEILE